METLTIEQMNELDGGMKRIEAIMCNGYFIGMATIIGSGCIVGGFAVSVLGAIVCSM